MVGTSITIYRSEPSLLLPEFLLFALKSEDFQQQLFEAMKQTTRNQVPITRQRQFMLPVPTLDIQKSIAAVLNEQMEAVEKARQNAIAIISPIQKKSLLQTLSTLEPLDEEFPDVDEGLLPLDDIEL